MNRFTSKQIQVSGLFPSPTKRNDRSERNYLEICKQNSLRFPDVNNLENLETDSKEILPHIKANSVLLDQTADSKIFKKIQNKTRVGNAVAQYKFASVFKLQTSSELALRIIESCSPWIRRIDKSFRELDLNTVLKILSSDRLNIQLELQVFLAAKTWLEHDLARGEFAERVLRTVRFSLLSRNLRNHLYHELMPNDEWRRIMECAESNQAETRRCSVNDFDVLFCGGRRLNTKAVTSGLVRVEMNDLGFVTSLPGVSEKRSSCKAHFVNDEIFVFGGTEGKRDNAMSVEKFSEGRWQTLGEMPDKRRAFGAVSYNGLLIIGGRVRNNFMPGTRDINICLNYTATDNTWWEIRFMREERSSMSVSVFEGCVVVCGGNRDGRIRSVERWDGDGWTTMAPMCERRMNHGAAVVGNKLFVVGGLQSKSNEVYDSTSKRFVLMNDSPYQTLLGEPLGVLPVGSELAVFVQKGVLYYDCESGKWREESCEAAGRNSQLRCVKPPLYMKYFSHYNFV